MYTYKHTQHRVANLHRNQFHEKIRNHHTVQFTQIFFCYRMEMQTDLLTKKNRVLKKLTAIKVNCNKQPYY